MDKTLQLVVIAAIVLMTAGIMMFLVQDRSSGLGDFLDNKKEGASCSINKTNYISACNCSASPPTAEPPADSIKSASDQCSWTSSGCPELC